MKWAERDDDYDLQNEIQATKPTTIDETQNLLHTTINTAITNIIEINTKSHKEELEQNQAIIKAKDDETKTIQMDYNILKDTEIQVQQQLHIIAACRNFHMGETSQVLLENQMVCFVLFIRARYARALLCLHVLHFAWLSRRVHSERFTLFDLEVACYTLLYLVVSSQWQNV